MQPEYIYKARITNVVDGDTVDAEVDLGFTVSVHVRFRLYGIDTPELNSKILEVREQAKQAKQFVVDRILNQDVIIETFKTDKYGRWLAKIAIDGQEINQLLVDNDLAIPYYGGVR